MNKSGAHSPSFSYGAKRRPTVYGTLRIRVLLQHANVYRLEPTEEPAHRLSQWVGACRYVYNLALEQRRTWGKAHQISYNSQQAEITDLRAEATSLHRKAANARKDFLHKLSTEIAKSHGIVKMEKLKVRNMTASASGTVYKPGKNVAAKSGRNRSVLDQGWSMFENMFKYKLAERGDELQFVDPPYTSQGCAECGCIDAASRIDQATFVCVLCGHTDNADVNAARNILQVRALAVEPPQRTLRRVGKRKQLKQATHVAA